MSKVAQIIPYFGKWPEWIDLYFYSCSRNQIIDFYIYSDCGTLDNYPNSDNIKIIPISFSDYKELVTERLNKYGGSFKTDQKYKLTDLKPFLGLIHENELKDYDWWGFGDLDLVYGDMSILLNEKNLNRYNLITTHNYHIAGHCTFMRNNEYYRTLCLKIADWQDRLSEDKHYGFDEAEWSNLVYSNIKYPLAIWSRMLKHINPLIFNAFMDTANRILSPRQLFREFYTTPIPNIGEQWIFDVKNCSIQSPKGQKLPYLHFLFFKKTPWLKTDNYWREGYWKITDCISDYKHITIDVMKVSGIN
jgi:conserved domain protein